MTEFGFPENVLDEIEKSVQTYMSEYDVVHRPLRIQDPPRSLGLFAFDWSPLDDSKQIGQIEPALNKYEIRIQTLFKGVGEVEARGENVLASKSLRAILYRDPTLVIRLRALSEEFLDTRETFKRYGVRRQSFLNNQMSGSMINLIVTEVWFETEVTQLL